MDADEDKVNSRNSRNSKYSNYLRNLLPSHDVGVMELTAKAIGQLALVSRSEVYAKFEIQKAIEWLNGERHEGKRHAAVSAPKFLRSNYFCFTVTLHFL